MWEWGHGGGMGFGWLPMLLFWVLIILGIIALLKWLSGVSGGGIPPAEKTPLQILKERYARGELDHDEYEQKKKDLES